MDVEAVAKGLSKSQRAMLIGRPGAMTSLAQDRAKAALTRQGLMDRLSWATYELTAVGLAVRAHLLKEAG